MLNTNRLSERSITVSENAHRKGELKEYDSEGGRLFVDLVGPDLLAELAADILIAEKVHDAVGVGQRHAERDRP